VCSREDTTHLSTELGFAGETSSAQAVMSDFFLSQGLRHRPLEVLLDAHVRFLPPSLRPPQAGRGVRPRAHLPEKRIPCADRTRS